MSDVYILMKDFLVGGLNNEFPVPIGTEFYKIDGRYECNKINGRVPCVSKMFVENNPEWFLPKEEPQSNDSFQWTDELVKEVVYWIGRGLISQDRVSDEVNNFKFIKTPSPKPQAENKPDLEKAKSILREQPQKLFTTEDGKDIFSGGDYWVLHKDTGDSIWAGMAASNHECVIGSKYFSTKEAAEKYIADNKKHDHIGIDRNGEKINQEKQWQIYRVLDTRDNRIKLPNACMGLQLWERIQSILRISDKEVFNVDEETADGRIKFFEQYGDGIKTHVSGRGVIGLHNLKKSKPQEQRIEVDGFIEKVYGGYKFHAQYDYSQYEIPEEKFPLIKKAIESVLNNESPAFDWMFRYTKSQVDSMCEDAFNAGRRWNELPMHHYKDFKDYQNSKQKQ